MCISISIILYSPVAILSLWTYFCHLFSFDLDLWECIMILASCTLCVNISPPDLQQLKCDYHFLQHEVWLDVDCISLVMYSDIKTISSVYYWFYFSLHCIYFMFRFRHILFAHKISFVSLLHLFILYFVVHSINHISIYVGNINIRVLIYILKYPYVFHCLFSYRAGPF